MLKRPHKKKKTVGGYDGFVCWERERRHKTTFFPKPAPKAFPKKRGAAKPILEVKISPNPKTNEKGTWENLVLLVLETGLSRRRNGESPILAKGTEKKNSASNVKKGQRGRSTDSLTVGPNSSAQGSRKLPPAARLGGGGGKGMGGEFLIWCQGSREGENHNRLFFSPLRRGGGRMKKIKGWVTERGSNDFGSKPPGGSTTRKQLKLGHCLGLQKVGEPAFGP